MVNENYPHFFSELIGNVRRKINNTSRQELPPSAEKCFFGMCELSLEAMLQQFEPTL